MLDGYLTTTPTDILKNPVIIQVGSAKLGVTKGGCSFDPGHEIENLAQFIDGAQSPIKGLDRKFFGISKISGIILDFGEAASGNQIAKLEIGSSAASAGSPNVTTVTPAAGGDILSAYQADVSFISDRAIGSGTKRYASVYFAFGLFTKYSLKGGDTKGPVEIAFEFEGRLDVSAAVLGTAPYLIKYREALP